MRTWTRATVETRCGSCSRRVVVGEPMQLLTVAGLRRGLVRCQGCAGEAPPDLPPLVERVQTPATTFERLQTIAPRVVPDVKARQFKELA